MKCPRCGGNMSSGVCDECGFPATKVKMIKYNRITTRYEAKSVALY